MGLRGKAFVPAAKIQGDRQCSIVSDYMGTPVQMYDIEGNKTWDCTLDIYGKVTDFRGESLYDYPFRFQGQYEDIETGLYYNRFRYYNPYLGGYISQDPIGITESNPTLYGYVYNSNMYIDIWGLDYFYQLIKNNRVVYYGITKNPIQYRIADHVRDADKDFTHFKYIEVENRIASRDLEGSALHNANGEGLINKRRNDGQYYHSYNPNHLAPGRTYYTQAEIELKMRNAKTGEIINSKVVLHNH